MAYPWKSLSNVFLTWLFFVVEIKAINRAVSRNRPNVIIILADDLGYGDLGWGPFTGGEMTAVRTPNLRSMAENGLIMTNFHTASPLCSPSRASIMVGLFPWRLGVDFIYAGDLKHDGTEEIDHEQLPLIPNIAMSFHDAGYYTAHIGKWHLGGQTHNDIPGRSSAHNNSDGCGIPGILQYGFDEYVGMSEGTGSMRYRTHQAGNTYSKGSYYLFKNDIPLPKPIQPQILTDRQTDEAIRVINEQVAVGRPFFLNLWYDAPHSPWEAIPPFYSQYDDMFSTPLLQKYASMISNMDMNIGRILKLLDQLDIASNTIVCFTSDNGPENNAGSSGPFLGLKRLLTEGGIRVPMIWQWKGRIKANSNTNKFALTTDLFPTLSHAAEISMPSHIRIDGTSFLPILEGESVAYKGDERMVLWYTHSPGYPKFAAAWSHGFKLLWNDYEGRTGAKLPPAYRLFNMKNDPTERNNLLPSLLNQCHLVNESFTVPMDDFTGSPSLAMTVLLAIQLQLQAHLFRYIGDLDWRVLHKNPLLKHYPSCHRRRSSVHTLTWHTMFMLPQFCGQDVRRLCIGSPQDVASTWKRRQGSWMSGYLSYGISNLVQAGSGMGKSIMVVLNSTRYQPFCSSLEKIIPAISNQRTGSDLHWHVWAHGNGINNRQRIHLSRQKYIYISGTGYCPLDSSLLILNLPYMLQPLSLCSTSYVGYQNQKQMDDAMFLVALNIMLRTSTSISSSIASPQEMKYTSKVAIIDPWLYHDWQLSQKRNNTNNLISYYKPFYSRMSHIHRKSYHTASFKIEKVFIPMAFEIGSGIPRLADSRWGVTVVFLPTAAHRNHAILLIEPSPQFTEKQLLEWKHHVLHSLRLPVDRNDDIISISYQSFHEHIQSEDHGIAVIMLLRHIYRHIMGSNISMIRSLLSNWKKVCGSQQVRQEQKEFLSLLNKLIAEEHSKDVSYYREISRPKFNVKL